MSVQNVRVNRSITQLYLDGDPIPVRREELIQGIDGSAFRPGN